MFLKGLSKFLYGFIVVICLCFLTSCIDYVQSISFENGQYNMYYKVTLSKALFAMMDQDPDEIFKGDIEGFRKDFPDNVKVNPVNTDIEVGAEFCFDVSPKTSDSNMKAFLPTVKGSRCYIPFLLGNSNSLSDLSDSFESDSGAIVTAMLSFAKCRVLISKKVIKEMDSAYFEGKYGQNYSIPMFDYGEVWCLEIPFIIFSESGKYNLNQLVLIKG